jgi:hypothetical protein
LIFWLHLLHKKTALFFGPVLEVAARTSQSELWRAYSDNLCKLAYAGNKEAAPGVACETIKFEGGSDSLTCKLQLDDGAQKTITNCVLGKSWRFLFGSGLADTMKEAKPEQLAIARRYLHEAAAAYLQVRLNAYHSTQEEFRRIDVAYRRIVVQREATLEQWKNVVEIPVIELDGYYSGGIKSAEIADLLVKALGFTAVAIGVSK